MSTLPSKLGCLLRVLARDPVEFYDRLRTVVEVKSENGRNEPFTGILRSRSEGFDLLRGCFSANFERIVEEQPLREIEASLSAQFARLAGGPFEVFHNGDFALARACYVACRLAKPSIVLETGVAYGVTSAFLLQALDVNNKGELLSIDLPPLGRDGDKYVGALIPRELKTRWRLFRGSTSRMMPRVLASTGHIDMFVHDSLHTYASMKREFAYAWSHLRLRGVLIADDVEGNRAFEEFIADVRPRASAVLAEEGKSSLFGVAIKG